MSELRLKDGTGGSSVAKVNTNNRLNVESVATTQQAQASFEGRGYNLNTGDIALTTAGTSAVAYFKYTGLTSFNIANIAVGVGAMGGTVDDPVLIKVIRDPSGGSIVDNAVAGDMNANRNFGNPSGLTGFFYKGVEGDTFTNGTDIAQFYTNGNSRLFAGVDFVIPQGTSIGIEITPNAVSAGNIYVAFIGHETENV